MTALLKKAFRKLENLPGDRQDEIATFLLHVDPEDFHVSPKEEAEWDALVQSPQSQRFLEKMVGEVREEKAKTYKSVP